MINNEEMIYYFKNLFDDVDFEIDKEDFIAYGNAYNFELILPIIDDEYIINRYSTVNYGEYTLDGNVLSIDRKITELTESNEVVQEILDEFIYYVRMNYDD